MSPQANLPIADSKATFVCQNCGDQFVTYIYRKPKFCSQQCANEVLACRPKPRLRKPEIHITKPCAYCGHDYHTTTHQERLRGSKYCSQQCKWDAMSEIRQGKNNPNYSGGHTREYGPNWPRQRRKAVRRDSHQCRVCGYHSGGNIILDVHHLKPIKSFNGDYRKANALNNLITLCRTCHPKVEKGTIPCPIP